MLSLKQSAVVAETNTSPFHVQPINISLEFPKVRSIGIMKSTFTYEVGGGGGGFNGNFNAVHVHLIR
jgi:hypothetical protein